MPRSLLEVRLATGVVVRTEKRVVRVRFSYREKKFVDELIVFDLDDKFDVVLGMPWLERHDPVIDWTKRTMVHFGSSCATVSDGPVGAAHASRGACDPPAEAARRAAASGHRTRTPTTERVVGRKCESNQKTQIRSDEVLEASRVTRSCRLLVSTHKFNKRSQSLIRTVPRTRQLRELMQLAQMSKDAPPSGVEVKKARRLWEPTLQAVRTVANVPHRKCSRAAGLHDEALRDQAGLDCVRPREEPAGDNKKKRIACSRAAGLHEEATRDQAGLDCVCPRVEPAGDQKEDLSAAGPGQNKTRGTGFRTRSERRKRAKLRKSRSRTETLQAVSAEQTQELETTVETLSVLMRTNTGLQSKKMKLENPPTLASELTSLPVTSWRRFARDLHDGRIEQICILSDVERMKCGAEELKQLVAEGVDALSAKLKKERFDEQSWDSLKSSPFYVVLREYRYILPDNIPVELPQDKGVQHEIDLVPGT
ncbi:hypothetical protein PR003_g10857 [Phytophthora rubi]|uniref:Reverse transcriptase n=2 Tax=Phytophthora rubi TaxID=129364 RepID=A0A6A4F4K8_9STRA|nr:hypothetical protein PR003_g10857 [Phytophthora rubi]